MKTTSRPSSRTPLNATVNEYQSRPRRRSSPAAAACSRSSRNASSSSCRSLKPLERRIALRSHCSPKASSSAPTTNRSVSIGIEPRAGPERGDEQREHDSGRAGADQRRAPAADDADAEHDRQRLDHLDGAREEGAGDDQDRAGAHGSGTSLLEERPRARRCRRRRGRTASPSRREARRRRRARRGCRMWPRCAGLRRSDL